MTQKEEAIAQARAKDAELCEHMRALVMRAYELKVTIGGCGCHGSPALTCTQCEDKTVDNIDGVFV